MLLTTKVAELQTDDMQKVNFSTPQRGTNSFINFSKWISTFQVARSEIFVIEVSHFSCNRFPSRYLTLRKPHSITNFFSHAEIRGALDGIKRLKIDLATYHILFMSYKFLQMHSSRSSCKVFAYNNSFRVQLLMDHCAKGVLSQVLISHRTINTTHRLLSSPFHAFFINLC